MKYLILILSILVVCKAHALSSHSQCSLDERPFILEYSFKDEKTKKIFEIKKQKKVINHEYEDAIFISNGSRVAFLDERGPNYRAFKFNKKTYFVSYEKRAGEKEICYPGYKEIKEKIEDIDSNFDDLDLSCSYHENIDTTFTQLTHGKFYKKPEIKKITKLIKDSKEKVITLDKTYKFKYYTNGKVGEAELVAKARINPEQNKAYRCAEGSKILVCGKNCLSYSKKDLYPEQFSSEKYRINLRDTEAQYLVEFELAYYHDTALDGYDEEATNKLLTTKLKGFGKPLDLKELKHISSGISDNKPFNVHSIRVVKYE